MVHGHDHVDTDIHSCFFNEWIFGMDIVWTLQPGLSFQKVSVNGKKTESPRLNHIVTFNKRQPAGYMV